MSLETAENITNRDGVRYGDIDSETLAHMATQLSKTLEHPEKLSPEAIDERKRKLDGIKTILEDRTAKLLKELGRPGMTKYRVCWIDVKTGNSGVVSYSLRLSEADELAKKLDQNDPFCVYRIEAEPENLDDLTRQSESEVRS